MKVFLSHSWGPSCPAYGGGPRAEIHACKSIACGDSCNTMEFTGSNHIGTHFDFPSHFYENGKTGLDFNAADFVFSSVQFLRVERSDCLLIEVEDTEQALAKAEAPRYDASLVLLFTGASSHRQSEAFWKNGPGIGLGVADYLRERFPRLRCIGIDFISVSSFQHRDVGRQVHKEILGGPRPLLIIEDMDLSPLLHAKPLEVVALPLRIEGGDGAPCTIIAEISS